MGLSRVASEGAKSAGENLTVKLTVRAQDGAEIKIEPSTVLRGTLHPAEDRTLTPKAVEVFGRSATMRIVSMPDLFGGKLCAALDRQHPRDLFDVHGLPGVERLPGPQWKLYNLRRMDPAKRKAAEERLRRKLGL